MRFDRRLAVLMAALAIVAGVWLLRSERPRAARPTAGERIILFGDSLIEGRGATPGHDLASVLTDRLGVPILNAGRGGDTTGSALSRLDDDVIAQNPRIVVVLLGGNDVLRRVPRSETFQNLATIVERIRARGAAVVLVGIRGGFFTDPYESEYEALARRTSAALVPDILDDILGHGDLMSDAIHPNDRG